MTLNTGSEYAEITCTGFIPCSENAVIRLKGMSFASGNDYCRVVLFDSSKAKLMHVNRANLISNASSYYINNYTETEDGCQFTIVSASAAYFKLNVFTSTLGASPAISVNEEMSYRQEGYLADGIKVKATAVEGGGGTDTSLGLTGATVGQTVKIKAVDENGIPTEWEATDMASGGEWHLIRSFTVPVATNLADDTSGITWFADESSNVFGFEINTDESGNAFSYHELYMRVRQAVTADAGDLPATIYINDIKIGQWHKAQVKLVNRVGEVKISRYANTYTVSYAGLSAFTSERNWVSSPALSNGIGFINSTDGAVEGNINKFKMLFAETNYMREGYLVSLWGR